MKNNKEILNEAFFKKANYKDKLRKSLPQYEPVTQDSVPSYQVTDNDEVKRRLAGTFGVTFGSNNIRSMASKSVKQFPIIISDNVEPETVVMLKKLMEEQYAEYINLLVSNQVIDLSAYQAGSEEGNIAIQALDTISGTNFGKSRVANKAVSGNISPDDIFANTPLYSLLRENNMCIATGDATVNALLENACIVPSEDADKVVKYMLEHATEIATLNEAHPRRDGGNEDDETFENKKKTFLGDYLTHLGDIDDKTINNISKKDEVLDAARGFHGLDDRGNEIYSKISTADIVVDKERMDIAINRSVGETLSRPENAVIRDKFEKATWLLQAKQISGHEYMNYLVYRLGIPVSDKARIQLLKEFKTSDLKIGSWEDSFVFNKKMVDNINSNRKTVEPIVKEICGGRIRDAFTGTLLGTTAGAVAGASYAVSGAGAAAAGSLAALGPLGIGVIAACAVGAGSYMLFRLIRKIQASKGKKHNNIEGWERVEALIERMDARRNELVNGKKLDINPLNSLGTKHDEVMKKIGDGDADRVRYLKDMYPNEYRTLIDYSPKEERANVDASMKTVGNMISRALRESAVTRSYAMSAINEDMLAYSRDIIAEVSKELSEDREFRAEVLAEATLGKINTIKGAAPVQVKYVEAKPGQSAILANPYGSRTSLAYGSTEIERRDNKDRRFDQPLIMTVKFKERYSDGKFADNELTAVIGILGKVIRVPSEEMEYILTANAEGETIEGLFKKVAGGDLKNSISDILSVSKISKDLQKLPQSGEIWSNLEKVTTLAAANKITGRRNNNIANAHIIFSQKEIDRARQETGVDYLRDAKKTVSLMKRYSAFTLMVANDPGQRVHIFDDQDNISWNVVPYTALMGKNSDDQLSAVLTKLKRSF